MSVSGPIFVFTPQDDLIPIYEQPYETEDVFQELLAKYPQLLLGGDDRTPYSALLLIAREQGVPITEGGGNHFSLDHLFVDQDGVPTLVEVKRRSDTRNRREIVAQMLDYASNGLACWTIDDLQQNFAETCRADGKDPGAVLEEFAGTGSDVAGFWQTIEENIRAERIRMIFVADEISPELRRIISFLNRQMRTSEMLAIELRQFVGAGIRAFVPDVIVKPDRVVPVPGVTWTEERFMAVLEEKAGTEAVDVARDLLAWGRRATSEISYGRGVRDGSLIPMLQWRGLDYYPIFVWTYGKVEIQFQWLQYRPPFDDVEKRKDLLNRLNAIAGISLPPDSLGRRPSFPLTVLTPREVREQFIAVLDWVIAEIMGTGEP